MSIDNRGPNRNWNGSETYLTPDELWEKRDRESLPPLRPRRAVGWERDFELGCTCKQCSPFRSDTEHTLARDEKAVENGELGPERGDGLKDLTAMDSDEYEIEREEIGSHRTHWYLRDVEKEKKDVEVTPDIARWKEMYYWQTGLKPNGKVTSRGICDENARRETAWKLSIAEAFASQLGLTESQIREVRSILLQLNVGRLGYYSDNKVAALAVIDAVTKERRQYAEWDTQRDNKTTHLSPAMTVEALFEQVSRDGHDYPEDRATHFAKNISETYDIDADDIRGALKAIRDNSQFEDLGYL